MKRVEALPGLAEVGNVHAALLSDGAMHPLESLAALASTPTTADAFRDTALRVVCEVLEAEVGLFVTSDGRASSGLDDVRESLVQGWDGYGREVHPVQRDAARTGAATDRRVLGGSLSRTRIHRDIVAPIGGRESMFVALTFRGSKLGFVMAGRTRRRFSDAALREGCALGPTLALGCLALGCVAAEARRRALDLSDTERDLLGYLELGLATSQIASARGTSFFTVRNQLSALYRKLGVANRTEAIGLRVTR